MNLSELADKINNEQIEAAKKAGKEYQGKENDAPKVHKEDEPTAKAEVASPASGAHELADLEIIKK